MKYFLSNRQLKELMIRAAPIKVALPRPNESNKDWKIWAKNVLPPEVALFVAAAEEQKIIIEPAIGIDLDCLTALLGSIVEHGREGRLHYVTLAIVVYLEMPLPRNPGSGKVQWPLDVEIGGKKLFAGEEVK